PIGGADRDPARRDRPVGPEVRHVRAPPGLGLVDGHGRADCRGAGAAGRRRVPPPSPRPDPAARPASRPRPPPRRARTRLTPVGAQPRRSKAADTFAPRAAWPEALGWREP